MAKKFNIVAELQLRGPKNLNQVSKQIQSKLRNVNATVNIKISRQALSQIQNLSKALNKISSASKTATAATSQASASTSKLGQASARTAAQMQSAATGAAAFGKQSALAVKRFAAFSVGAGIMMGITNAIREGTKAAVSFERQMIKVSQVTGTSMSNLQGLQREITSLARNFGVASSELVEVARTLSQTGLAARDVTVAMKSLALSSLAPTFKDMANTAEGAIAIMRQFGVTADGLGAKLGSINALAGQFAVESQDLIFAIRRAGGAFQAAGGSLEELLALFTSVRATTRESAETIATGFRTIFTRIQRPKTIEFLRSVGVELQNAEGNFIGPFEAVKRLNSALKTLESTDPRFAKVVEELGGFRQVSKVIPLIQQFATAQQALRVAQQGQGSLAKDAATAQASLAVQISKVREEFLGLFRDLTASGTFKSMTTLALGFASSLISVAESIKPILPLLGALATFQTLRLGAQFVGGFAGGLRGGAAAGGGGAGGVGRNLANQAGGANSQQLQQSMAKLTTALASNTTSVQNNSAAMQKLTTAMISLPKQIRLSMPMGGVGRRRFATGGIVPGTGNRDTVPAMLTPGEFVIRKSSVKKYGAGNLAQMNSGGTVPVQRFFNGGKSLPIVAAPGAGLRAAQGAARQTAFAQGRSKALKPFDAQEAATITRGRLAMKVVTQDGGKLSDKFADEDIYGGAFMAQADKSASFKQGNTKNIVLQKTLRESDGYKKFQSQLKQIQKASTQRELGAEGPALAAAVTQAEKDASLIFDRYAGKNQFRIQTGALKKGISESVEGILLEGVESSVFNAARQISTKVRANTDKNAVFAKMKSANIDQVIGNLFENVLSVTDVPYSPKDTDPANAPFDFPKGLGANLANFNVPSGNRVQNRPTDAKSNFTADNLGALLKKVKNFNIEEAGLELDKVFDSMTAKLAPTTQQIVSTQLKASGGSISGSDTVPALLTPGEFVVNKKSAQRIGYSNLNAINKGRARGYATGGIVQQFASGGTAGGGGMGGGNMGMGLMMAPMAIQMLTDAIGVQNKSVLDSVSALNSFIMALGMASMFGINFGNVAGVMNKGIGMLGKGLTTVAPNLMANLAGFGAGAKSVLGPLAGFGTAALATGAAVAGVGFIVKQFGDAQQDAAIKSAENAKTISEENQARKEFESGQQTSRAGTGMMIGAGLGMFLGPLGAVVGGAVGAAIGASLGPDLTAIEAALERGRDTRLQKEMSDSLKLIEKNGVSVTNLDMFADAFSARAEQANVASTQENRDQFRANFEKSLPQVRAVLDKIAESSTSFEQFENAMGGAAGRILESINEVDPATYARLREELEAQIQVNKKLKESREADIEAAKAAKSLVGELDAFADSLRKMNSSLSFASTKVNEFSGGLSGAMKVTVGGAGVQAGVFGTVSKGGSVNEKMFTDAVDQLAPNERIGNEVKEAGKLMMNLPALLEQAVRDSAGNDERLTDAFTAAAGNMGLGGAFVEQLATKIGTLSTGRSESEGTLMSEIMADPQAFAEKLGKGQMQAMMAGMEQIAQLMQETFNNMLSIRKQILDTEKKQRDIRMKIIAKMEKAEQLREKSGKERAFTGRDRFLQEQKTLLGAGGPAAGDFSAVAGNVQALGVGLRQAQDELFAAQEEIRTSQGTASVEEQARMADNLQSATDKVAKFQAALQHASESTHALEEAQKDLAKANFKIKQMEIAAFGTEAQRETQQRDILAAQDIMFADPATISANMNEFGDAAAEAYQGGLAFLRSLQAAGIKTMRDAEGNEVNIQSQIDKQTVERLATMGVESGQFETMDEARAFYQKQFDERNAAEERQRQAIFDQIKALEELTTAINRQAAREQALQERGEKVAGFEREKVEFETELKVAEKDRAEAESQVRAAEKEVEAEENVISIGSSADASKGPISTAQAKKAKDFKQDFENVEAGRQAERDVSSFEGALAIGGGATEGVRAAIIESLNSNPGDIKAAIKAGMAFYDEFFGDNPVARDQRKGYFDAIQNALTAIGPEALQLGDPSTMFGVGGTDSEIFGTAGTAATTAGRVDNQGTITAGQQSGQRLTDAGFDESQITQISQNSERFFGALENIGDELGDAEVKLEEASDMLARFNAEIAELKRILDEIDADITATNEAPINLPSTIAPATSSSASATNPLEGAEFTGTPESRIDTDRCPPGYKYNSGRKICEIDKTDPYWETLNPFAINFADKTVPPRFSSGGSFGANSGSPAGSLSKGTDTRLAVLTPGEFVVNRSAAARNLGLLQAINNGNASYASRGGRIGYYQNGSSNGMDFSAFNSAVQAFASAVANISMSGQGGGGGGLSGGELASALNSFPESSGVKGLIAALNDFKDTFGSNSIEVTLKSEGVDVNLNGAQAFTDLAKAGLLSEVTEKINQTVTDFQQGQIT